MQEGVIKCGERDVNRVCKQRRVVISIDTVIKQSTQKKAESENKTPNTNKQGNVGPHNSSDM